ncbi:MAG: hypothetical protein ACOZAN_04750 [Patescibacteria group bacterium]
MNNSSSCNKLISLAKKLAICLIILATNLSWVTSAQAEECNDIKCSLEGQSADEYLDCNKRKQGCWEAKITESKNASNSLKNTINILNGQISLQELQIDQTLAEITKLTNEINELVQRINGLSLSLDKLTNILIERIRSNYKFGRQPKVFALFSSDSFGDFTQQLKYLDAAQLQTASAMKRAESQRLVFNDQRLLKEKKQAELESKQKLLETQRAQLNKQKSEQQFLLNETKNNEARYQQELAKTLAELQAIQNIIAGNSNEGEVRDVKEGEVIASVIPGVSACSTGTHLHFEITKDGVTRDPSSYLQAASITWSNSPDSPFGFNGGWPWPLNDPAIVTQGYGMTYFARVRRAYGGAPHTGIDILSKNGNLAVKAVRDGKLYRGSISCGGGLLRYVRVEHKEDGINTYYLHVNY